MINTWINIETGLYPNENEAIWMYDAESKSVWLGSLCYLEDEGWFWTISNGIIYAEDGMIKTETILSDNDMRVTHWCQIPKLKDFISIRKTGMYPIKDEIVWMYNEKTNFICLGSHTYLEDIGWVWTVSCDKTIYNEDGEIKVETEYDGDYDITHWFPLPSLPKDEK